MTGQAQGAGSGVLTWFRTGSGALRCIGMHSGLIVVDDNIVVNLHDYEYPLLGFSKLIDN